MGQSPVGYSQSDNANFKGALWTFKQQLVLKSEHVVECDFRDTVQHKKIWKWLYAEREDN